MFVSAASAHIIRCALTPCHKSLGDEEVSLYTGYEGKPSGGGGGAGWGVREPESSGGTL